MAAAPQYHNERAVARGEALVHAPDGVDDEVPRGHGARLPRQRAPQVGALDLRGRGGALLAQEDFKNTYTWMWNTVPGVAFGGTTAWTVLPSGSTTAICWPGDLRGRFVPNEAVM